MEEGAELGGALRSSIDLAAASELDMVQASDLASVALSTFGASMETPEERAQFVNDALNNMIMAADASVAEVSGMAEALKMVGPAAGGAGFGIEEVNNAIAILSTRGIQGSMAGTSLNSMINSLRDLTPKASEALDDLGIAVRDASTGEMLPMVGIIEQFEDKLGDATAAERDAALGAIFTSQGLRAMDTMLEVGAEGWTEMEDATASAATMQEQAARKADTLAGKTEAFEGTIETLLISLGDKLLPIAGDVIDWLSGMAEEYGPMVIAAVGQLAEGIRPLIDNLLTLAEGALPQVIGFFEDLWMGLSTGFQVLQQGEGPFTVLMEVLDNLLPEATIMRLWELYDIIQPIIAQVTQWLTENVSLQDVLIGLGAVLAAAIIPAIATLVSTIVSLLAPVAAVIAVVALARQAWETNFLGIRDIVASVATFISNAIQTVRAWWAENNEAILAKATMVWQTVKTVVMTVFTAVKTFIQTALATIRGWWDAHGASILTIARSAWNGIVNAVTALANRIIAKVQAALDFIQAFWDAHGQAILQNAQTAWEMIQNFIQTVLANITDVVDAFAAALEGDWETFGSKLRDIWRRNWEAMGRFIVNIGKVFIRSIGSIITTIKEKFTDTDWGAIGRSIIEGIAKGVTGAVSKLANAAVSAAKAGLDAAKGFLGANSPSTRARKEVGRTIPEGVALGVLDMAPLVQRAMARAMAPVTNMSQVVRESNTTYAPQYNLTTQSIVRPGGLEAEFEVMSMGRI
jgi:TP901 family phage tail tape measure protein